MDLLNPIRADLDLKLHGHISYVGTSSMEITVRIESHGDPRSKEPIDKHTGDKSWYPILLGKLTMVFSL